MSKLIIRDDNNRMVMSFIGSRAQGLFNVVVSKGDDFTIMNGFAKNAVTATAKKEYVFNFTDGDTAVSIRISPKWVIVYSVE